MKFVFVFLTMVLLSNTCFSQVMKNEDRASITLCWNSDFDNTAQYLVYFSRYKSTDTTWRLMGTTSTKTFEIAKETFKGDIAFGVKAIYYNDTSALHTSLEMTACLNGPCDETCTLGAWYLSWHIGKPNRISVVPKATN